MCGGPISKIPCLVKTMRKGNGIIFFGNATIAGLFAIEVLEETRLGSEKGSTEERGVSLLVHGGQEGSQKK